MIICLIQSLPDELLEQIFIKIYKNKENQIELVCKRWNRILSNQIIKRIRNQCLCISYNSICFALKHRCICDDGPYHAIYCRSDKHPCICSKGPNNAYRCKAKNHPCICLKGILNIIQCKSNECPCICNENPLYIRNCRGH